MDLHLQGRTAIVTGASRGIGLAVVRALVDEGALVIAAARASTPEIDELVAAGSVRFVEADLSLPEAAQALVSAAGDVVDILVNNVGSAPARTHGFLAVTDEMWQSSLNLNLLATVRMTRAVLPLMIGAGKGSVVSVSSVNSTLADPAVVDYSAAKAGLANFSKSMSKEFGARGIRFNTVSPGPVATALWLGTGGVAETFAAASGKTPAEIAAGAATEMVTGRFTQPEEVAAAVAFLASDRSGNTTGSDLTIDGGMQQSW